MEKMRSAFWLAAPNYYILAFATSTGFFFVMWGLLDDVDIRAPWQTAGVSACILLVGTVILRELILRRQAIRLRQPPPVRLTDHHKLTSERAAAILHEIGRKSDAANVLERSSSGHREVSDLCAAFIKRLDAELAIVQPSSPRLAALLKGRSRALDLHRFHTLRWAEVEARSLSGEARTVPDAAMRSSAARRAVAVVDEALESYPTDERLLGSKALLVDLATSIEVTNTVDEAEDAVFAGETDRARRLYREALYMLARDNIYTPEREHAAHQIRRAMERLPNSHENG